MAFQPSFPPYGESVQELANWVQQEFFRLKESLEAPQEYVQLMQVLSPPDKYSEGTLVNFGPGAVDHLGAPLLEGFYVFRAADNLWHLLEEI